MSEIFVLFMEIVVREIFSLHADGFIILGFGVSKYLWEVFSWVPMSLLICL